MKPVEEHSVTEPIVSIEETNEHMELQTHFSDSQTTRNSSMSLSTVVENIQSEPILFTTSKYYESEIEDISTVGPGSEIKFMVEHLDNSFAISDHSRAHDESKSTEKKGLSAVDSYGFSQDLTVFPLSEPPTANHRDSTTSENHLQLQPKLTLTCKMKLSRFWVRELRITDRILHWEKLKCTMFEELLPNTLLNNNSNATVRKSLLDSSWETNLSEEKLLLATRIQFEQCRNMTPMPPPRPPYQYLQRTKVVFQTDMEHLTKGCSIIQVVTSCTSEVPLDNESEK